MKKILLSAMALVAAMSVNAQVEIGVIDAEALGLGSDLVDVPAGTVISQTESVTVTTLFDDQFKSNSWSGSVKVGDQEATLSGMGLQGNTNGPGTAASEGTFPTQGCIYHFVANKDGYIYVFQKGSNNKNYVVFEEKARIPYVLTIDQGEDGVRGYDLSTIEGATVDEDGVVYIASDYAIQQVTVYTESTNNGTSVIKFPVYEGLEYDVLATGSKMSLGGFAFDTTGDATISFTTGGDEPKTTVLLENGYIPGGSAPAAGEVEIGVIDAEALGLGSDLVDVPAGTVISQTESVTVTTLFDDQFKSNSWSGSVKVGNQEATLSGMGLQGNTNGPGTAASEGTFPTQGCIYHFEANKDGYIYVFQKGSNNKNYVVFEEKARIPYVLTIDQGEDGVRGYDLSTIEGATVEDDGVVYIADDYAIQQVTVYTESTNNGTSVIKFPVYEGLGYDVLATGSKMSLGGFAFDTTGNATISFTTGGDEPTTSVLLQNGYIPGGSAPTAIQKVQTVVAEGAIYNLAGQKVNGSYKGIVIQNGKKFVIK